MSGYGGNPDLESEHALILAENGIEAARQEMMGRILSHCDDCGDSIPEARIKAAMNMGIKCECCVPCQEVRDKQPKQRVKMLDWVL